MPTGGRSAGHRLAIESNRRQRPRPFLGCCADQLRLVRASRCSMDFVRTCHCGSKPSRSAVNKASALAVRKSRIGGFAGAVVAVASSCRTAARMALGCLRWISGKNCSVSAAISPSAGTRTASGGGVGCGSRGKENGLRGSCSALATSVTGCPSHGRGRGSRPGISRPRRPERRGGSSSEACDRVRFPAA